jgi:hypothetical protein
MKNFLMITAFIITTVLSAQVKAGLITVLVDQNNVSIGETVELTLTATNFDAFDIFDLAVNFDTELFSFIPQTFESDLPGFGLFWNQVSNGVAISFVDFLPSSGDFLLAKFELTALQAGSSHFDLIVNEFALSDPIDIFAPATAVDAQVSGQVFTSVTSVPEPGMLSIMLLGFMAFVCRKRKLIYKNK